MNILITGSSGGIGYQTALALAKSGRHNIYALSRNEAGLSKLEKEVQHLDNGSAIIPIVFDLNDEDFGPISKKLNSRTNTALDILINNAGILYNKNFLALSLEEWHKTFDINLFAVVKLIKTLYPFFNLSTGVHIVNIGSMGGIQGTEKFRGLSAYSASKAALNVLTESLASEFEEENISVNAINPGAVETLMFKQAFPGQSTPVSDKQMGEFIAHFALFNGNIMNGRIIQASLRS